MRIISILLFGIVASAQALALDLGSLSNADATGGLKDALTQGSAVAIGKLGVENGFLGNDKVKIPLPDAIRRVESGLRLLGMQRQADELVVAMNRAAEQAVPEAKALLTGAIKNMSVQDAKGILTGGDDSVTMFFREKTAGPLAVKFLPIVKRSTDRLGLAQKYNQLVGQLSRLGLITGDAANIETYVTNKTLDGLYLMIGEEEHAIRQNPAAAGSAIVSRVFSALQ